MLHLMTNDTNDRRNPRRWCNASARRQVGQPIGPQNDRTDLRPWPVPDVAVADLVDFAGMVAQ